MDNNDTVKKSIDEEQNSQQSYVQESPEFSEPFVQLPMTNSLSICDLNICCCIDVSASTNEVFSKNYTYLDIEKRFVSGLRNNVRKNVKFISWADISEIITDINRIKSSGGTMPACIFEKTTCDVVTNSDVLVLITDGEIGTGEINHFGKCMVNYGSHFKAVIGVIVGRRSNDINNNVKKPSDINVSVLVPAMISNGCIIFHNTKDNYLMWSSGIFRNTLMPNDINENTNTWENISTFSTKNICEVNIPVADSEKENNLINQGYIPFGMGLFFHPDNLLKSTPKWDELMNYPFDRICQYFRVSQRYQELYDWFKLQRDRFHQEFMADHNEKQILDNLVTNLQTQNSVVEPDIIRNFCRTRNMSLARFYANEENVLEIFANEHEANLFKFINHMINVMEEDNENLYSENTYTTSSISKTRYVSTKMNKSNGKKIHSIRSNFNEPYGWLQDFITLYPDHQSSQCECPICYEKSVPFVLVRNCIDKNNIADLVDFPFKYFYPQIICGKCADYFCKQGIDPVRVGCIAAIPIVNLVDDSKKYFLDAFEKITNYEISQIQKNNWSRVTLTGSSLYRWVGGCIGKDNCCYFNNNINDNQEMQNILLTITLLNGLLRKHIDVTEFTLALDGMDASLNKIEK